MKRSLEKLITSLILMGFLIFGVGVILLVVYQTINHNMPFEAAMVLIGLALLLLGILAAKIFGQYLIFEDGSVKPETLLSKLVEV